MDPTEVGPGVSAAATSSARWRRLLDAGAHSLTDADTVAESDAGPDAGANAVSPERTITFVVGAAAKGAVASVVHPELGSEPESGASAAAPSEVELDDATSTVSRARFLEALGAARTGWRFRIVGDELALGALRALLHDAGVLDEEIEFTLVAAQPGGAEVLVHCGHCQAKTSAAADASAPCSGCGLHLTVYYHFSRRQGAYLGYFADAEMVEAELVDNAAVEGSLAEGSLTEGELTEGEQPEPDGAHPAGAPPRSVEAGLRQGEPVLA